MQAYRDEAMRVKVLMDNLINRFRYVDKEDAFKLDGVITRAEHKALSTVRMVYKQKVISKMEED